MGIRFYCPNGHKLNVKAFQAGRKGICPYCGAKIQIPTHSTRKSSKDARAAGQRRRTGAQAGSAGAGFSPGPAQGGSSVALSQPGHFESPGYGASSPAGQPAGYSSPVSPAAPGPSGPGQAPQPSGAAIPHEAAPSGPAAARQGGAAGAYGPAAGYASAPTAPSQPASPSGPAAATPSTSVPRDPLSEGGDVVWYVRPPSGGQFGPATPDIMRSWIDQGRVSPDSLVWREGWRDWQEAGEVFPQLGAGQQVSPFRQFEHASAPAGQAASPTAQRVRSRRQSQTVQMAIVVALVLAVIVLFGVFLWVLTREDEAPPENARAGAAAAVSSPETAALHVARAS